MRLPENVKIAAVVVCCTGLLLANLGGWRLLKTDEPRYAEVAREMLASGNYLLPRLNGEPYPDKPPLLFWCIAALSRVSGDVTPLTARLPSAVAAAALLLVTYFFTRKLYGPVPALLATAILFTSAQFLGCAVAARFDALLALWCTLALFLLYLGYTADRRRTLYYCLAYASMGCGVLTKGPVAIAIPLLAMALFLASGKDFRGLQRLRIGLGLLIVFLVVGLWLVPACLTGGEGYWQEIIFRQTLGRTVDSFSHKRPLYFYLLDFPVSFLPWSFFIPSVLVWLRRTGRTTQGLRLSLSWFAATFVFFSLISGKRSVYLLPLYPAAAQVMAGFWSDALQEAKAAGRAVLSPKHFTIPALLLFLSLIGTGAAAVYSLVSGTVLPGELIYPRPALYLGACLGIAGGLWGLALIRRTGRAPVFWHICAVSAAAFMITVWLLMPAMDVPAGAFCKTVQQAVGARESLVATFEPSYFNYFLRREAIPVVKDISALESLVASDKKTFILTEQNKYAQAPKHLRDRVSVVASGPVGHQEIYLVVNRVAGSDQPNDPDADSLR